MRKKKPTSNIFQKSTCLHWLGITLLVLLIGCNDPQPPAKEKTSQPQTTYTASNANTVLLPPPTPFYEKTQTYNELQAQIAEKEQAIPQESDLARQLSLSWEGVELEQEVRRYVEEAKKLAEVFAPVADQSSRLCQAKLFFDEGRFCDADAVLNLGALLQKQSDLKIQEAAQPTEGIQQNKNALAWEYCIKALLWKTFYNRPLHQEQARQYFEEALQLSTHPRILLEYARLFQKQEQYLTAYALGKRACALCEENTAAYLPELADTLHLLFFVERRMDWDEAAAETGQRAVPHYRKLMQTKPDTYAADFFELLRFLGYTHDHLKHYEEAERNHQEIVDTCRRLAANNPEEYEEKLIYTMQDLSYIQRGARHLDAAQKTNNEALLICRQGLRKKPKKYKPLLAYALQHSGYFIEDRKKEKQNYVESIALYRELAQENPKEYLLPLADILHKWGNFQVKTDHFEDIKNGYRNDLKSKNPFRKAKGIFNRFVYSEKQIIADTHAKRIYEEALQIHRDIFPQKPYWQLSELAELLTALADIQSLTGEREAAKKNYEEALEIRRAMTKGHSYNRDNLARALQRLAILHLNEDEFKKAEGLYLEALDIYRELSQEEPKHYMYLYTYYALDLSKFYLESLPDKNKAIALAKEVIDTLRPMKKKFPALQNDLVEAYEILRKNGVTLPEDRT